MIRSTVATGAALLAPDRPPMAVPEAAGMRASTRESRCVAVERAVDAMREHIYKPLSLEELARVAMFSPYHFHRVFRLVTGLPPAQYLTALRMAEACRLLLTTPMPVTEVCFEVGFGSLGTFTTSFRRLVGAAPQQLRWLAERHARQSLATLVGDGAAAPPSRGDFTGWITTPNGAECIAMLGLFPRASPHGAPVACAVVRGPGAFNLGAVPAGRYRALAIGFPPTASVLEATLIDRDRLLVATLAQPLHCDRDRCGAIELGLRAASPVDPPIVLAAPILLAERAEAARRTLPRRELATAAL